ncbi:MAG: hypothetical protein HZA88_21660 [Verrucomicrobia bacterium]|nr:hypothetical protein [Verrucomicrobiota bacterium]
MAIPWVSRVAPRVSRPTAAGMLPTQPAVQTYLVEELQQKLAQRSREVARLKTENRVLWGGLSNAVAAAIGPAPEGATEEDAARRVFAEMHKRFSTEVRQGNASELATLAVRLHLSDKQTKTVLEAMEKEYEESMMSGNLKLGEINDQRDERIFKPILTPEQWTGYQQYRAEERSREVQVSAQSELIRWSIWLQLSPQQQEQISPILQQQYAAKQGVSDIAVRDQILDDTIKALRAVLTPEQQQGYEKIIQCKREGAKLLHNLVYGSQDPTPAR